MEELSEEEELNGRIEWRSEVEKLRSGVEE